MALTINTNLMSLNSQRHLSSTQDKLSKSLERLSSGLRINHAADDASGLAISEKLRAQISGLQRATMNAQDGISMLQTAEGALTEVSSMLQRMRELAVQASNGTYTSNDRVEIQKEVEQLKDEIDRISSSTEFNTKKLLNGDGTALWSASSNKIDAIIRGEVAEGNYEINVEANKIGQNQVFKTDIMTLQEGKIGAEITTAGGTTNTTNISKVENPESLPSTGTSYFTINVSGDGTAVSSAMNTMGIYTQPGSNFVITSVNTTNTGGRAGYIEMEFNENFTTASGSVDNSVNVRFIDAKSGFVSEWQSVSATALGGDISVDIYGSGGELTNSSGDTISGTTTLDLTGGGQIQKGDKILFSLTAGYAGTDWASSGGGTIQMAGGPLGQDGPTLVYTAASSLTGATDAQNTNVKYAFLDTNNGNVNVGNLDFSFSPGDNGSGNGNTKTGSLELLIAGSGDAATTTSKLKDISRFVDADGNNIFENKQELTIWGGGESATVYLEGDDTISDLEEKMTDAIVDKLGLGSKDEAVNSHLVDYISVPSNNGKRTVQGTFVIQTALAGEQGELAFSGDQRLINGLSLAEVQNSVNNTTKITISNAHTGDLIGVDETGNDRVNGVIQGVELVVDSRANVKSSWDATQEKINFSKNTNTTDNEYFLHVVDNSTDLQIGPNEGQTLSVSIPQLDTVGLGVDKIKLVSQDLAQRAIPDIDRAIDQVVTIRATIGAQINRLDYSVANLKTAEENMTASESRIRDLDIASEMAKFTKNQILSQAGTSMLAQANQVPQNALTLLQG